MPGPVLVLVSVVLIAAAVAGAWVALGRRPDPTGIVDLLAVDGEYAVMVRDVARDPGRSFLSLVSAERGEVWGAMIPGYEPRGRARTHLLATAGVLTVRGSTGGVPYIHAFAAARGAKLGRYALSQGSAPATGSDAAAAAGPAPGTGSDAAAAVAAGSVAGGGRSFELVVDAQGAIELVAIDLEQGAPMWRHALGAGPVGPLWLRERHVLVRAGERLHVLDRATGAARAGGVALARPCVVSDRVYGVDGGAVHVLDLAGGGPRATGVAAAGLAGVCGAHRDRDVLALAAADGRAAIVAVDARTGAEAWRVALDAPLLVSEALYLSAPDALAGDLPRFLPVLAGSEEAPRLSWLDLESGSVATAGAATPVLREARVLHAGERFYLWAPAAGPALAVLDGARGALAAAVEIPDMAPLWPRHVAGGRVWITRRAPAGEHGDGAARGGGRAWLVLGGERLDVVAAGLGGEVTAIPSVTDARDRLARALGLR